jgi:hypothetical protein
MIPETGHDINDVPLQRGGNIWWLAAICLRRRPLLGQTGLRMRLSGEDNPRVERLLMRSGKKAGHMECFRGYDRNPTVLLTSHTKLGTSCTIDARRTQLTTRAIA